MEIKELHQLFLDSTGVSTDTRTCKPGSIFFALKGEHFNANEFAETALGNGAAYAVIDEKPSLEDPRFIVVSDALETLQNLASYHRRYCGTRVLGLTGSNGKTTTKELINSCLSRKYKTIATAGNLNNHIGVPLTLLNLTRETEIAIVEMGANHPQEIAFLCNIAQPDFGYITNFGKAHLEGFKSPEGVIAAKSELYDHLKAHDKTLFLNLDDPIQHNQRSYSRTFGFGNGENSDLEIKLLPANPFAKISVNGQVIQSNLIGDYNSKNIAAAFSIGYYFEVPFDAQKQAIEEYTPNNNRSQIIDKASNKILLDAYNANPTSMAAAIDNLVGMDASYKIAILGDMFELGEYAVQEHEHLAEILENSPIDEIYLLGKNFYNTQTAGRAKKFTTIEEFKTAFTPNFTNAIILIKGSRGMALERILDYL